VQAVRFSWIYEADFKYYLAVLAGLWVVVAVVFEGTSDTFLYN